MSRPIRLEFPGAHYHVTSRATPGSIVFTSISDRTAFLQILGETVQRFSWVVHAYVLMDDHYHLIVETPDGNLSQGMRQLNGVYTQCFNRNHANEGALFEGRFKGILFEREQYLKSLCRHLVLNPVRRDLVWSAEEYRWSSYLATAGLVDAPAFLQTQELLRSFGKRAADCRRKYRDYVSEGAVALRKQEACPSPLDQRSSQVLLGSEDFVARMRPLLTGKTARLGPRRVNRRRSLKSLFNGVESKSRIERNALIKKAHIDHNYTLAEIGNCLGLHYTTVSKVING